MSCVVIVIGKQLVSFEMSGIGLKYDSKIMTPSNVMSFWELFHLFNLGVLKHRKFRECFYIGLCCVYIFLQFIFRCQMVSMTPLGVIDSMESKVRASFKCIIRYKSLGKPQYPSANRCMHGYDELSEREMMTRHGRAAWSRAAGFFWIYDSNLSFFFVFLLVLLASARSGTRGFAPCCLLSLKTKRDPSLKILKSQASKKNGK